MRMRLERVTSQTEEFGNLGPAITDLLHHLRTTRFDPAQPRIPAKAWEPWKELATRLQGANDARGTVLADAHRYSTQRVPAAERAELRSRLTDASDQAQDRWTASLGTPGMRPLLQHGFLRGIDITSAPQDWSVDPFDRLPSVDEAPLLTHLVLRDRAAALVDHLCRTDRLQRFTSLSVHGVDDGDSVAMALARYGAPLLDLELVRCELTDEGADALARTQAPALRWLDLSGNFLTDPAARSLAGADWPSLERLGLSDNELTDVGAVALARAAWPRLTELYLQRNFLEGDGVVTLLEAPERAALKVLLVASNPLDADAQAAHAAWRAA